MSSPPSRPDFTMNTVNNHLDSPPLELMTYHDKYIWGELFLLISFLYGLKQPRGVIIFWYTHFWGLSYLRGELLLPKAFYMDIYTFLGSSEGKLWLNFEFWEMPKKNIGAMAKKKA